jgi:hypothetical protein
MIHVAAGYLPKIKELEDSLRAQGYKRVGTFSKLGPKQYTLQDESAVSSTLTWNDAGTGDASPPVVNGQPDS